MKINGRRVITVFALVVVLFICSWGVVYASAERMLELFPVPNGATANDQPVISANWLNIPGVNIKSAEVYIDDQLQNVQIPKQGTGFSMQPAAKLAEGTHTVRAKLTYEMGMERQVETSWDFVVDTEPPPLGLADGATFFVSAGSTAAIPAVSEAGAKIDIFFNDKHIRQVIADGNGAANIKLKGLKKRNKLRLMARDSVGNIRSLIFPVIKDVTPPEILSLKPAEDEIVRVVSPMIEVTFKEEESGLRSIVLSIDGSEAAGKGDDGAKKMAYLGNLLSDGEHTAKVEAVDYAGRSMTKEWTFTVDSRRIVVNRGERKLYFYRNGNLERVYGVAVGQPRYPTPVGHFSVVNRQVNPSWHNPGSRWAASMPKVIGPSFNNPLGVRALALSAAAVLIHGTSNYGSIGSAASHGCIRMRNSDIVGFFPLVEVGVPVDIIN